MNDTKQNATLPKGACQVTCPDCHLTIVHRKATWACCDGRGCLACTGIENALPAEPVIEVAPGEMEWEGPPERETQRERSEYAASQRYPQVPAVPAQEAPREVIMPASDETYVVGQNGNAYRAEPQAGAQVPSQEHPMRLFVRGMTREQLEAYALKVFASMIATEQTLWRTEAHLNTIKSYATEAAKTPITRESILAAPQVDEAPIPENLKMAYGMYKKSGLGGPAELIERIAQLEAENRARKLTQLTQSDEMQGFCRLVLSEIGGGQ